NHMHNLETVIWSALISVSHRITYFVLTKFTDQLCSGFSVFTINRIHLPIWTCRRNKAFTNWPALVCEATAFFTVNVLINHTPASNGEINDHVVDFTVKVCAVDITK